MKQLLFFFITAIAFSSHAQYRLSDFKDSVSLDSRPKNFVKFQNIVFFVASDSTGKRNIWQSDGSEAGTKLFQEATVSDNRNLVFSTTEIAGTLYFSFDQAIWKMGANLQPQKLYQDEREGFFDRLVLVGPKLFFNLTYYLDLKTNTVKKANINGAELPYNLPYTSEYRLAGSDFAVFPYPTINAQLIHFQKDTASLLLRYKNSIRSSFIFKINSRRFFTSLNDFDFSIYEVLPDTLKLSYQSQLSIIAQGIVNNRYQVVTTDINGNLSFYTFDGNKFLLSFQRNDNIAFNISAELYRNEAISTVLAKDRKDNKFKLFSLNLTDGQLSAQSGIEIEATNCFLQNNKESYAVFYCNIGGVDSKIILDKITKKIEIISTVWDFNNLIKAPNGQWLGAVITYNPYDNTGGISASTLMVSGLNPVPIKKIVKNISSKYVFIIPESTQKINIFTNKNKTAALYQINGNDLKIKELFSNSGIPVYDFYLLNNSTKSSTFMRINQKKGERNFLHFDKQTLQLNKATYSLNSIYRGYTLKDSNFVYFNDQAKYSAPYNYQGIVQKSKITGLYDNTQIYYSYQKDNLFYGSFVKRDTIPNLELFGIIDLKNDYLYQSIVGTVWLTRSWINTVIVVVGTNVYAFMPNEPLKKQFLFSFERNFDGNDLQFLSFNDHFIIHNGREFWYSQGNCQSSKQIYTNFSASRYSVQIYNTNPNQKNLIIHDKQRVIYISKDSKDIFEFSSSSNSYFQALQVLSDHSFVYSFYDNGTITLFHYDFLTKQKRELSKHKRINTEPFDPIQVQINNLSNSYQILFKTDFFIGKIVDNQPDEIKLISNTFPENSSLFLYQTKEKYFISNGNRFLASNGDKIIELDTANRYNGSYYASMIETTKNVYFTKSNNDIIKVKKTDLSYRIIKAKPEWQNVVSFQLLGSKVLSMVYEQSLGRQLWLIDDEAGQEGYPTVTPTIYRVEKNQCEPAAPTQEEKALFVVYPNPAKNEVSVILMANEIKTDFHLEVFDMSGKKCLETTYQKSSAEDYYRKLDLANLTTRGLYLVRCQVGNKSQTIKVLKE